jgi:antitoxin MazE
MTVVVQTLRSAVRLAWDPTLDRRTPKAYIQCRYMAATTQIAKWGNSLGLRLPKSVAREAQLDEGDTVDLSVDNGTVVIRPSRPRYALEELVARITARNRHGETEWSSPVGHEAW